MATPFSTSSYPTVGATEFQGLNDAWGINSELYNDEWEEYLARHQQLVEQIRKRLQAGAGMRAQFPQLNAEEAQALGDHMVNTAERERMDTERFRRREIWDATARAREYNIPTEGKSVPELWAEIEAARTRVRADYIMSDEGPWSGYLEEVGNAFAVGSLKGLVRLVDNLPFIGDAAAKRKEFQNFDMWLSQMDEAVTGHLAGGERTGQAIAQGFASTIPYIMPVGIVNNYFRAAVGSSNAAMLATRLGPLGKVALGGRAAGLGMLSARQAFTAGAATTAVFESGGDAPWQERALIIALGGGLEGGGQALFNRYGEALLGMFGRLKGSFLVPDNITPYEPQGRQAPIVDAEWSFADELGQPVGQEPPFLPQTPQALPPGGTRGIAPGAYETPGPGIPPSRQLTAGRTMTPDEESFAVAALDGAQEEMALPAFASTPDPNIQAAQFDWRPTDPDYGTGFNARISTPRGDAMVLGTVLPDGKTLQSTIIGVDVGPNGLGAYARGVYREVIRQVRQAGFDPEMITGFRVSGSRLQPGNVGPEDVAWPVTRMMGEPPRPGVVRPRKTRPVREFGDSDLDPAAQRPRGRRRVRRAPAEEPEALPFLEGAGPEDVAGQRLLPPAQRWSREEELVELLSNPQMRIVIPRAEVGVEELAPSAVRATLSDDFAEFSVRRGPQAVDNRVEATISTSEGPIEIIGNMEPDGSFRVAWVGDPEREVEFNLGRGQTRKLAQMFIRRLNEEGLYPTEITGERISGVRGGRLSAEAAEARVPVERFGIEPPFFHGTIQGLGSVQPGLHIGTRTAAESRVFFVADDAVSGRGTRAVMERQGQLYPVQIDPKARTLGMRHDPISIPDWAEAGDASSDYLRDLAERGNYQVIYYRDTILDPGQASAYIHDPSAVTVGQPMALGGAEEIISRIVRPQDAAASAGAQVTKQATIMESPLVAELSVKPQFDDMDVVVAALSTYPNEVSIVRNVGDVRTQLLQNTRGGLEALPGFTISKVQAGQYESTWGHRIVKQGQRWDITDANNRSVGSTPTLREAREMLQNMADDYAAQAGRKLMPHTYRFVEHPSGRTDLLISTGQSVTNKMANQYRDFGFFEGMRVQTFDGAEMIVRKIENDELIRMYSPYSKQEYLIYPDEIVPGRATLSGIERPMPDAPALYEQFRNFAETYMEDERLAAGIARSFAWTDKETATQLPRLLDEFFEQTGVDDPIVRETYKQYFSMRRVDDYRNLAPSPEAVAREQALDRASEAIALARQEGRLFATVDELAESQGFSIRISESGRGFELVDNFGDLTEAVPDEASAAEFLRNVVREQPEVLEPGNVPEELMDVIPGAGNPGQATEPWITAQAEADAAEQMADDIFEEVAEAFEEPPFVAETQTGGGAGGGRTPPPEPPFAGGAADENLPVPRGQDGQLQPQAAMALRAEERQIFEEAIPPGDGTPWQRFKAAMRRGGPAFYGMLDHIGDSWMVRWSPTRNAFAWLDEQLKEATGIATGLYEQYNAVSTGIINMNNEARQWLHEADDIVAHFRRIFLRDGTVVRIQELGDQNQRIAAMEAMGYSDAERAAQNRLAEYLDRFFRFLVNDPAYTIDDSRYVIGYMSRVRDRQMAGDPDAFRDIDMLPRHLKFFAEEFRRGELDLREWNVAKILPRLIRAAMFHKHVTPAWTQMASQWDTAVVPESIRAYTAGWLKVVRAGRDPRQDTVLTGIRHFLNENGVPVTNRDMQAFVGGAVGNIYRSFLGFRVDALLREAIQPFMAGVKIGHSYVRNSYGKYLLGTEQEVKEMVERALQHGWFEPGRPRLAMADVFETQMTPMEPLDAGAGGLAGAGGARAEQYRQLLASREVWSQRMDKVWDAMPVRFRKGIQDTWLDPLLAYSKVTSMGKIVAGNAAYDAATDALVQFKLGKLTVDGVADRIGIAYYPKPFQQEFRQLVEAGQLEDASIRYASEVVADAMMRVGTIEQPQALRESGIRGRLGMMFGNFSMGFLHYTRSLIQAPPRLAVRGFARYGAVAGTLAAAEASTGFKFSKWLWHQSLWFSGGPVVDVAARGVLAAQGLAAEAQGYNPSYPQQAARQSFGLEGILQGAGQAFNPYQGIIRTAQGVEAGAWSPNPVRNTVRFLTTGERGDRPERQRLMEEWSPGAGTGGFPTEGQLTPPFLQGQQMAPYGQGQMSPPEGTGQLNPPFIPGAGAIQ